MKKFTLVFLILALMSTAATAQSVQQSGSITPGHLPVWLSTGVLKDAGTAAAPANPNPITSLGVVGSGPTICSYSGPQTGSYQRFCLGTFINSPAQISLDGFNGAIGTTIQFAINGNLYDFPFTLATSGALGPNTSGVGNIATWNNTQGTLLADSGVRLLGAFPGLSSSGNAPQGGSVDYSPAITSAPGIALTNAGVPWMITGTANALANDVGLLFVSKETNYSVAGLSTFNLPSAILVENRVRDGTWSVEHGIHTSLYNYNTQHSQPGSTAAGVGITGKGFCLVAACSATWGANFAGYDTTGQINPTNPLYGLEVDVYAHGTDNNQQRIGIQIVAGTPDGIGAVPTVTHGLLFSGDGSGSTSGGQFGNMIDGSTTKAINAISLGSMNITGSAISSPGFDLSPTGVVTGLRYSASATSGTAYTLTGNAGNILSVGAISVTNGISLNAATISGSAFGSTGFDVDGSGNITAKKATFDATAGNGINFTGTGLGNMLTAGAINVTNGITISLATISNRAFDSPGFFVDGTGNLEAQRVRLNPTTIGALAACAAGTEGQMAWVTDSAAVPAYLNNIGAGGGGNKALVVCNGTNWQFH